MMRPVLVDASSAILLYKAFLFGIMCDAYPLAMVAAVVKEITVANRRGAADFCKALANNHIRQVDLDQTPDPAGSFSKSLGDGERETLLAYGQSQARFILIDDAKGARACRKRNIPYINALLCPELLYGAGYLQRRQRDLIFKNLLSLGRYSPKVIAYAKECRQDALAYFYPPKGCPD